MTTIIQPDAADYTGLDDQGNEYLLTRWPDRSLTLAVRELGATTWSAPVVVEAAS